jgi:hypothetical protein
LPLLLGIVASVGGDGTKLPQLVNTNAILCWQQVQELINTAFSNTGQPVFEFIELQTKAAKEKTNMSYCFVVVTPVALAPWILTIRLRFC